MLTRAEARYVITEITRLPLYKELLEKYKGILVRFDERKRSLSEPNCPQGHEVIGSRGNEFKSNDAILADIVTREAETREKFERIEGAKHRAEMYYESLVMYSDDSQFVTDYFNAKNKVTLCEAYYISNPYDYMIRVVMHTITEI